ncbi:MAG TPA: hypothetical protein VJ872_08470 [Nocardioides sp.]|nr:hypothetical protein [Nocardioides sp.]
MSWNDWNPPRWLVWYGHAWAIAWGYPSRLPPREPADPNDLAKYLKTDLDAALARLLAEEDRR